jgi:hypothetical protein
MAQPCWEWHTSDGMALLVAECRHGHRLTPCGDPCRELLLDDEGGVLDHLHPCGEDVFLPWRGRLWNRECGCGCDVVVELDRQVYAGLCVSEVSYDALAGVRTGSKPPPSAGG